MKKTLVIFSSIVFLFSFTFVFAESGSGTNDLIQARKEHREEVRTNIQTLKANLAEIRSEWREKRTELLDKLKAEKEELKNKFKEKFTEEKCNRVQARIENRNGFFKGTYEKHTAVYVNLVDRINKFITRADAAKLDTTKIKADLATLQDKIEKFKDDYAAYKAKFDETKNYTCGHSEGDFKAALLDARELLKTVHADAADIRKYVRETILPDIKNLKNQMADDDDGETETGE